MHFPQVERTSCSAFPYREPYFQEKSPFRRDGKNAILTQYPHFEFAPEVSQEIESYEFGTQARMDASLRIGFEGTGSGETDGTGAGDYPAFGTEGNGPESEK
jgi:hypothetical protein